MPFHIRLEIAPWKFETALRKKRSRVIVRVAWFGGC
ncbi:hypothetical protein CIPAW_08G133000 [Carya illinoinensis]|uniref:Uncharacterized protein n=1 Tax=Carya illinoinensis TaxID=32201 RepID=A0A8T1PUU7_CARIL|nr:hypothetical protein CIPAW_08G133000 [Carya illinoinensis]